MRWTIPHGGGMVEVLSKRSLPSMYLAEALCISLIAVGSICGSLKNGYRSRGIDCQSSGKNLTPPLPQTLMNWFWDASSAWVSSGDIPLQLLNRVFLSRDDPLHKVADR